MGSASQSARAWRGRRAHGRRVFTLGRRGGVSAGGSRFFRINLWAPLVPQPPGERPGEPERGRGPEGHRVPGGRPSSEGPGGPAQF